MGVCVQILAVDGGLRYPAVLVAVDLGAPLIANQLLGNK